MNNANWPKRREMRSSISKIPASFDGRWTNQVPRRGRGRCRRSCLHRLSLHLSTAAATTAVVAVATVAAAAARVAAMGMAPVPTLATRHHAVAVPQCLTITAAAQATATATAAAQRALRALLLHIIATVATRWASLNMS